MEWCIRESWPVTNLLDFSYCVCCNLRCYRSRIIPIFFHTFPYKKHQAVSTLLEHCICLFQKCTVLSGLCLWRLTIDLEVDYLLNVKSNNVWLQFYKMFAAMKQVISSLPSWISCVTLYASCCNSVKDRYGELRYEW